MAEQPATTAKGEKRGLRPEGGPKKSKGEIKYQEEGGNNPTVGKPWHLPKEGPTH